MNTFIIARTILQELNEMQQPQVMQQKQQDPLQQSDQQYFQQHYPSLQKNTQQNKQVMQAESLYKGLYEYMTNRPYSHPYYHYPRHDYLPDYVHQYQEPTHASHDNDFTTGHSGHSPSKLSGVGKSIIGGAALGALGTIAAKKLLNKAPSLFHYA